MRMGEHIYGLHSHYAIHPIHQLQIARLRGGVAAHIHDSLGRGTQYHIDHTLIDTRARRIQDHYIGVAVARHEVVRVFK